MAQKESSELIRSELVRDETELDASDSSFNRLGCGEEATKNRPRARILHAAEFPDHSKRHACALHGWAKELVGTNCLAS